MNHNSVTNYLLIGTNKKEELKLDLEKIPLTKEIIYRVIELDFKYWEEKKLKQPGVERFILLNKVLKDVKINAKLFDIALEELDLEKKIIAFNDGHFTRYIKVSWNV